MEEKIKFTPEQDEFTKKRIINDGNLLEKNKAHIENGKIVLSDEYLDKLLASEKRKNLLDTESGQKLANMLSLYKILVQRLGEEYMSYAMTNAKRKDRLSIRELCHELNLTPPENKDEAKILFNKLQGKINRISFLIEDPEL